MQNFNKFTKFSLVLLSTAFLFLATVFCGVVKSGEAYRQENAAVQNSSPVTTPADDEGWDTEDFV